MNDDIARGARRAWVWALLGLFCWTSPLLAQNTGTIAGTVIDGDLGETLIGANVVIAGTLNGSTTDIDGKYAISGIAPGTYDLKFSYIGYNTATVTGVEVVAGETTTIDFTMTSEAIGLDEVVVEARAIQNTEAVLLRDRQKSAAVSDAISAEAISRSGSGDAAAAMTKVTGASVVGGRYVYIRGLGDRYTNTTLNGSTLPSADPDRKAFQLDLFPSSLLENIVTLKTFTPDKPGDFSGGLVDVATKTFPDGFTLQISSSITYDEFASLNDNFLGYQGSDTDWLGYDDGERGLPSTLDDKNPESDLPNQQDLRDIRRDVTNDDRSARADSLNQFAQAFNTRMTPTLESTPVNYSFSAGIGGQSRLLGMPIGYTGSLTYGRSYSYYDDGQYGLWALRGGTVADTERLTAETIYAADPDRDAVSDADSMEFGDYRNTRGTEDITWGASGTLALRPHPNHEINFTLMRTQSGKSEATFLAGFRDQVRSATFVTRSLDYEERSLQTYQARGEHFFAPIKVEWKASFGSNTQEEPDLRFFSNAQDIRVLNSGVVDTLYSLGGGNAPDPQRYFRDLEEDNFGLGLDISVPFQQWSGIGSKLKLGGSLNQAERSFRQRRFEYQEGRSVDFREFDGDIEAYFAPENLGVQDTLQVGDIVAYNAGLYVLENSPSLANYDADRNILAGYAMLELPLTRKIRLIGGVRLETTDIESISQDDTLPDSLRIGELDNTDLLPSINGVYELTDRMNLRAAWTRTLARPTFRELAPFQSFDFVGGDINEGNPLLKRTLITNWDLRWEWFIRPGELLAVSGFYKEFENPIERVIRTVGEGRFISFQNVPEAQVYGVEFEARKRLDTFTSAPILKNMSVGGNFSVVESVVDIPEEEMVIIRASEPDADDTRSLEGQSPFLVNLNATYENYEKGTVLSVYYNLFGKRLLAVTEGATPDVFEKGRPDLDITFSQRLPANLRLKVNIKNLLGSDMRQIQEFKGTEYTYLGYSRARTISVGVSYVIE